MTEQNAEANENVEAEASAPEKLAEDHPLVKTLAAQKAEIKALKERARRLDEIEEAQKTDAEKAADRLAAAEKDRDEALAVNARLKLALEHGLSEDDAVLLEGVTDPEALERLAKRLATEAKPEKRRPNPDPNQGKRRDAGSDPAELFAAAFDDLFR